MSDLTYACSQPSPLARRPVGDTLLLAAYAENAPASGTGRYFRGNCATRGWWPAG